MVVLTARYPFLSFSMTLIVFQGYSSVKLLKTKFLPDSVETLWLLIGGSGGFFLACDNFWRMFDNSFPAFAFFFFFF